MCGVTNIPNIPGWQQWTLKGFQAACICYAAVGVPFTLIFLSAMVQRLLGPATSLLACLARLPGLTALQVLTQSSQ